MRRNPLFRFWNVFGSRIWAFCVLLSLALAARPIWAGTPEVAEAAAGGPEARSPALAAAKLDEDGHHASTPF
jgi:hypothetical protein